jgi:acyl-CoA thioesterase-1
MNRIVLARTVGLIAWLCVGACSEPEPRLALLDDTAVILAFGDSLTHGSGAPSGHSYPDVLSEISGREVVNAGIPGELSAAGLARLPAVLDRVAPQLMLLCHGGNDLLRKKDLAQARRNIEAMIALARERDIAVVLLGVPKPGIWLRTAELYLEIATATQTPIVADALATILADAGLKSDPVHPNAAGYRRLAENIHAKLESLGAVQ